MTARIIVLAIIALAAITPCYAQAKTKPLTITLSSTADILITRSDGKRFGHDPALDKKYDEIEGAEVVRSPGREPVYDIPPGDAAQPLTITIYGRETAKDAILAITGGNFVFGVNGIPLTKGSVITIRVAPGGDLFEYSPNQEGAVPRIILGTDPVDAAKPSYVFEIHRPDISAGTTIRFAYIDQKSISFGDDEKRGSAYDLKITRLDADGRENKCTGTKLKAKRSNHFEVDLAKWDGKGPACVRSDARAG